MLHNVVGSSDTFVYILFVNCIQNMNRNMDAMPKNTLLMGPAALSAINNMFTCNL